MIDILLFKNEIPFLWHWEDGRIYIFKIEGTKE